MLDPSQANEKPIKPNKFSALSIHLGTYPTKKDDLESLGYILAYFLRGGKLWEHLKDKGNNASKDMEIAKLNLTPEIFCQDLPQEMVEYFSYIKGANPGDKPDYLRLNKLLRSMVSKNCANTKNVRYDWTERAVKNLAVHKKEPSNQQNTTPVTDVVTESDKQAPIGAIDLDKDNNFVMRDDMSAGADDDESNIDEGYALEVPTEEDALSQTIHRLQGGFPSYFIRDLQSPQNSKKTFLAGNH